MSLDILLKVWALCCIGGLSGCALAQEIGQTPRGVSS